MMNYIEAVSQLALLNNKMYRPSLPDHYFYFESENEPLICYSEEGKGFCYVLLENISATDWEVIDREKTRACSICGYMMDDCSTRCNCINY